MNTTMLAAGIMAAFSFPALHGQDLHYDFPGEKPPAPAPAIPIPTVMHFCAAHCFTFTLEKDRSLVNTTNLPGQHDERRVFTIEKWTPEAVLIHRRDTGSSAGEGTMTGKMREGNSSVLGEGWAISWGPDLDKLPKSDEEWAERAGVRPQLSPTAQQNLTLLQLLFSMFSGGSGDSERSNDVGSMIGCAPNYSGCPHIPVKH